MRNSGLATLPILLLVTSAASAQNLPVADAGSDATLECAGPAGTRVRLDGSASSDADGQALTYSWTSPSFAAGSSVTGAAPTVALPVGTHVITLEVADGVDGSDTDEVVVLIGDTTPPVVRFGGTPLSLWPPNHSFWDVEIDRFVLAASDSCDGSVDRYDARWGEVTSDEPENGTGDGDTPVDIRISDECRELEVRSERKGNGDGRVYQAEIVVRDASGNTARAVVNAAKVDKAPPKPAIDSGDVYSVSSDCAPDGPGMCPPLPEPSCDGIGARGRAYVMLFANPRSERFDGLRFSMLGIDSSADQFGDPTDDTEYQLCVYGREDDPAADFGLLMNPRASAGPAWIAYRGSFLYRMRYGQDDGLNLVSLRAVPGGRGSITISGSGPDLGVPELPLDEEAGMTVQLHNSLGQCWSAEFDDALRNGPYLFQAVEY